MWFWIIMEAILLSFVLFGAAQEGNALFYLSAGALQAYIIYQAQIAHWEEFKDKHS